LPQVVGEVRRLVAPGGWRWAVGWVIGGDG